MKRPPSRPDLRAKPLSLPSSGLMISIAYLVLLALGMQAIRKFCKRFCKNRFQRIVVKDFLAAVEATASCFEFGTVINHNGLGSFSVILFFIILWRKYSWQFVEDDSVAYCPCNDITNFLKGTMSLPLVIAKQAADVLGSPVAFKLTLLYWNLGLRPEHASVMETNLPENCVSEINVSLGPAMLTEAIGTLILCFVWSRARAAQCPILGTVFGSMVSVAIVNLTMPFTGAYFSPALASGKMWGCKGNTYLEHLMTYWVAPITSEMALGFALEKMAGQDREKQD